MQIQHQRLKCYTGKEFALSKNTEASFILKSMECRYTDNNGLGTLLITQWNLQSCKGQSIFTHEKNVNSHSFTIIYKTK